MPQTRLEKEISKALARQEEARAALQALPDDAPDAIRRTYEKSVESANAAVSAINTKIEERENRPAGAKVLLGLLVGFVGFLVFIFLLGLEGNGDSGPVRHGPPITEMFHNRPHHEYTAYIVGVARLCRQKGYVGPLITDVQCSTPNSLGNCGVGKITLVCTSSVEEMKENADTLRKMAKQYQ